jgi:hypothetical protein
MAYVGYWNWQSTKKTDGTSDMCHQCQRNDKGRVVRCQGCKNYRRRYCVPCITRWYAVCPLLKHSCCDVAFSFLLSRSMTLVFPYALLCSPTTMLLHFLLLFFLLLMSTACVHGVILTGIQIYQRMILRIIAHFVAIFAIARLVCEPK